MSQKVSLAEFHKRIPTPEFTDVPRRKSVKKVRISAPVRTEVEFPPLVTAGSFDEDASASVRTALTWPHVDPVDSPAARTPLSKKKGVGKSPRPPTPRSTSPRSPKRKKGKKAGKKRQATPKAFSARKTRAQRRAAMEAAEAFPEDPWSTSSEDDIVASAPTPRAPVVDTMKSPKKSKKSKEKRSTPSQAQKTPSPAASDREDTDEDTEVDGDSDEDASDEERTPISAEKRRRNLASRARRKRKRAREQAERAEERDNTFIAEQLGVPQDAPRTRIDEEVVRLMSRSRADPDISLEETEANIKDWSQFLGLFGQRAAVDIMKALVEIAGMNKKRASVADERNSYVLDAAAFTEKKAEYVFRHVDDRYLLRKRDAAMSFITAAFSAYAASGSSSESKKSNFIVKRWAPFCVVANCSPTRPRAEDIVAFVLWMGTRGKISSILQEVRELAGIGDGIGRDRMYAREYKIAVRAAYGVIRETTPADTSFADTCLNELKKMKMKLGASTIQLYLSYLRQFLTQVGDEPSPAFGSSLLNIVINFLKKNLTATDPDAPRVQNSIPPPPSFFQHLLMETLAMVVVAEQWRYRFDMAEFGMLQVTDRNYDLVTNDTGCPINRKFLRMLRDNALILTSFYFALRGGEAYKLEGGQITICEDAASSRWDVELRPGGAAERVQAPQLTTITLMQGGTKTRTADQNRAQPRALPASVMTNRLTSILTCFYRLNDTHRRICGYVESDYFFNIPGNDGRIQDISKNASLHLNNAVKTATARLGYEPQLQNSKFCGHGMRKACATAGVLSTFRSEVEMRNWGQWGHKTLVLGDTYLRADAFTPDGGSVGALCRFLNSGYQHELIPSGAIVEEQRVFEKESFHLFEKYVGDISTMPSDWARIYYECGWYALYGDETKESAINRMNRVHIMPMSPLPEGRDFHDVTDSEEERQRDERHHGERDDREHSAHEIPNRVSTLPDVIIVDETQGERRVEPRVVIKKESDHVNTPRPRPKKVRRTR